jgi:hypothetical protein
MDSPGLAGLVRPVLKEALPGQTNRRRAHQDRIVGAALWVSMNASSRLNLCMTSKGTGTLVTAREILIIFAKAAMAWDPRT